jgi:hypothetical protein
MVVIEKLKDINFLFKLKDDTTQVVHTNRLKLFPPGRDVMAGNIRRPEWNGDSNMSEASTVLITFSEDGDDGGEGEEAYGRNLHWDEKWFRRSEHLVGKG